MKRRSNRILPIIWAALTLSIWTSHCLAATFYAPWPYGTTRSCTQGNGGSYSHTGNLYHAWDFSGNGVPVCASAPGNIVTALQSGDNDGWGTTMVIDHGDGTFTRYAHMQANSLTKTSGSVDQGEVIGLVGKTGYVTGPHLHFQVQSSAGGASIAASFADIGVPTYPNSYTSQNNKPCDSPPTSPSGAPDPGAGTHIQYAANVQDSGWQGWVQDGSDAGTTGQSKRLEAIAIRSLNTGVHYRAHEQSEGWQGWRHNGEVAGNTGCGRRMEAIEITVDSGYSVSYQVHVAGYGWMGVVSNGQTAGTTGESRRIEAIRIWLTSLCTAPSTPNLTQPGDGQTFPLGSRPTLGAGRTGGTDPQTTRFWIDGVLDTDFTGSDTWPLDRNLPSGDYTWHAQKRNGCGTSSEATRHFHINYPPNNPALASPANGAVFSSRNSIPLSWNASADPDGGPGSVRYCVNRGNWGGETGWIGTATSTNAFSVPSDGVFAWQVKAADDWDGSGYSGAWSFTVDTVAPSASTSVSPAQADGANGWYKSRPTLTISASDATSGVAHRWYTVDGGSLIAYTSAVPLPEGTHTYSGRADDYAGNAASSDSTTVKVDTVAPISTVTLSPAVPDGQNGWHVTAPTLGVVANDPNGSDGSGLATSYYVVDQQETPYTAPVSISGDGMHACSARAVDNAGNSSTTTALVVKLDTAAPVFSSLNLDPESRNLDVIVASWSFADDASGIAEYEYWIGSTPGGCDRKSATSTGTTNWVYATDLNLTAGHTYYFTVRSRDSAGHWCNPVVSQAILATGRINDQSPNFNVGGVSAIADARISTNYMVVDSLGQFVVDQSASANYVVEHGYWHGDIGPSEIASVGAAKALPDGLALQLGSLDRPVVVTAGTTTFSDRFYVEQPDRSSGIAVQYGATGSATLLEGDQIWLTGKMNTLNGERVIQYAAPHLIGHTDPIRPLFLVVPNLGGWALNDSTPGVLDGLGLNNLGLLVKTYGGAISYRDSQGRYFYVDNGDELYDGSHYGVRVICDGLANGVKLTMPQYGSNIIVTGISSSVTINGKAVRAIRPRYQSDIVTIH